MKSLIIGVLCFVYSIPAVSVDDDCHDLCVVMANAGEVIMKGHQKGYPMKEMMATYSGAGDTIDQLIMVAYDSPRYSTEESQQKAIGEYRDKVYLECVSDHKIKSPSRVAMPHSLYTNPTE
jgi:hypothetical protein